MPSLLLKYKKMVVRKIKEYEAASFCPKKETHIQLYAAVVFEATAAIPK